MSEIDDDSDLTTDEPDVEEVDYGYPPYVEREELVTQITPTAHEFRSVKRTTAWNMRLNKVLTTDTDQQFESTAVRKVMSGGGASRTQMVQVGDHTNIRESRRTRILEQIFSFPAPLMISNIELLPHVLAPVMAELEHGENYPDSPTKWLTNNTVHHLYLQVTLTVVDTLGQEHSVSVTSDVTIPLWRVFKVLQATNSLDTQQGVMTEAERKRKTVTNVISLIGGIIDGIMMKLIVPTDENNYDTVWEDLTSGDGEMRPRVRSMTFKTLTHVREQGN